MGALVYTSNKLSRSYWHYFRRVKRTYLNVLLNELVHLKFFIMKKAIGIICFSLVLGLSSVAQAQEADDSKVKQEVKQGAKSVKKGAKKASNKTAEVASKGKAKVTDEVYKDKVGPNGETIYIDNHSRYYWVDKRGRRHYVNEAALKNKVE
jgi:hypothetical protein